MVCSTGKATFRHRKDARKFRSRRRGLLRERLHVYLCSECGYFHLGHTPKGFYERSAV